MHRFHQTTRHQIHDRLVRTSQEVEKKEKLIAKLWMKQRRRELIYLRRSELGKRMFGKSQKRSLRKVCNNYIATTAARSFLKSCSRHSCPRPYQSCRRQQLTGLSRSPTSKHAVAPLPPPACLPFSGAQLTSRCRVVTTYWIILARLMGRFSIGVRGVEGLPSVAAKHARGLQAQIWRPKAGLRAKK